VTEGNPMNRTRVVFVIIITIALLIVGAGLTARILQQLVPSPTMPSADGKMAPSSSGTPLPKGAVEVTIQSSNTKQDWLDQIVTSFNAAVHTVNGRVIVVTVKHGGSGGPMNDILNDDLHPVVWSPASHLWVTRFNQTWQDQHGGKAMTDDCPATMQLPLGIVMWRPMAEALGWPNTPVDWSDIVALANDPEGWSAYGHPEWGQFKFGHPHPEHSNSAMLFTVAIAYSAAGVTDGLTVEMVKSPQVVESLRAIEERVFHYGKLSTDLLQRMTDRGPQYLHAVTSYEGNVIKWNREHATELRFPLVLIYPSDGTFWVEHPYCILDKAKWVSAEQARAAEIFGDYILAPEQQALAVNWGLRPAHPDVTLHEPIALENGAVPSITRTQTPHLGYPSDEIVGHILDVWHQVKKKATIVLLLDTSGSMKGQKMRSAAEGAAVFLDQMYPDDEVLVYTFASNVIELSPSGRIGETREALRNAVRGLYAEGNTALYQAVLDAMDRIADLKAEDEATGEARIYGIVLLSDGMNEGSHVPSWNDVLSRLPSGTEASGVKIYAVAYGADADQNVLTTLANRTNGKLFSGDVNNIEKVYFLISSEF
jgi:Ca-activated chloride channel family protein